MQAASIAHQTRVVCDACRRERPVETFKHLTKSPRCDDCRRTMRERYVAARWTQRQLAQQGITVTVCDRAHDVRVDQRPSENWLHDYAEPLAAAGVILVDDASGVPVLPLHADTALRTVYRALIPLRVVPKDPVEGETKQAPTTAPKLASGFTAAEEDLVNAHLSRSLRAAQRTVGLFLGRAGVFTRSDLWAALVALKIDQHAKAKNLTANLTMNMKKDAKVFFGDRKSGWKLTEAGEQLVNEMSALTPETQAPYVPTLPTEPPKGVKTKTIPSGRLGPLVSDTQQLVAMVQALAKQPGATPKLAKHAEDVRLLALIHSGTQAEANKAVEEVIGKFWVRVYKYAWQKIRSGLLSKEEAEDLLRQGILHGAKRWSPMHSSGAQVGTVIYRSAERELQTGRTRAGRAEGVIEIIDEDGNKTGKWTKAAQSYSSLGTKHGCGDTYQPHATKIMPDGVSQSVRRANNKSLAPVAGVDTMGIGADLAAAFAALDPVDAAVVRARLVEEKSVKAIMEEQGMTYGEVNRRFKEAKLILQEHLQDYE
jgi:DNA-directed RNA polymerase specialized sigma24 family protein